MCLLAAAASTWSIQPLNSSFCTTAKRLGSTILPRFRAALPCSTTTMTAISTCSSRTEEVALGSKTLPEHRNLLLRNKGSLQFEDVTGKAGVHGAEYSFGASVADYNGDGLSDLLVVGLRGSLSTATRGMDRSQTRLPPAVWTTRVAGPWRSHGPTSIISRPGSLHRELRCMEGRE